MPRGKASGSGSGRRGRPPGSTNAKVGQARALAALSSYRSQLLADRARLEATLGGIEAALASMGGRISGGGGGGGGGGRTPTGRDYRRGSLKEFIEKVLSGGAPMAVKDISAGVVSKGYKSKNKTLAKSVGIALTGMPGVTKVGRGLFKLG